MELRKTLEVEWTSLSERVGLCETDRERNKIWVEREWVWAKPIKKEGLTCAKQWEGLRSSHRSLVVARKLFELVHGEREREGLNLRKLDGELLILSTPFLRVQRYYQVDLVVLVLPLCFIFWLYAYLILCLFSKKRKQKEN